MNQGISINCELVRNAPSGSNLAFMKQNLHFEETTGGIFIFAIKDLGISGQFEQIVPPNSDTIPYYRVHSV